MNLTLLLILAIAVPLAFVAGLYAMTRSAIWLNLSPSRRRVFNFGVALFFLVVAAGYWFSQGFGTLTISYSLLAIGWLIVSVVEWRRKDVVDLR